MTPFHPLEIGLQSVVPVLPLTGAPSPLVLCDRLLTLAQDADRAGCSITAEHLLQLAHTVLDEKRPN